MTTSPPPHRKWHFTRWLIVFIIAVFGWSGWQAYAFRSALSLAKTLGWAVYYPDPLEAIRKNWKAAFKRETWLDGVTAVGVQRSDQFEHRLDILHRLNPKHLKIESTHDWKDLSGLKGLTRLNFLDIEGGPRLSNVDVLRQFTSLKAVWLVGCWHLTDVDVLKSLTALEKVWLVGCWRLTNVDGIKDLPALTAIDLTGCTGLTKESVAALKAALPKAQITGP